VIAGVLIGAIMATQVTCSMSSKGPLAAHRNSKNLRGRDKSFFACDSNLLTLLQRQSSNRFTLLAAPSIPGDEMRHLSRRALLSAAGALAATHALPASSQALITQGASGLTSSKKQENQVLYLSAAWETVDTRMPEDMLGLSYESAQLSEPDFFSGENVQLISLVRRLAPEGVLRLGGNLSEFTQWSPHQVAVSTDVRFRAVAPDAGTAKAGHRFPITPAAIRNLKQFLDATGWQALYGLNLAHANRDEVVEEAKFVAHTLEMRLLAFQIGNEPNHYVMNGLRREGYSFKDYLTEWSAVHRAVLEAIPSAKFAGPDVAEGTEWIQQFAEVAPKSVVMLTGHHYVAGPPSDPFITPEHLLAPDLPFANSVREIELIAAKVGKPFVMAETNTCYKAGKRGVSDVYAAALWSVDYFLQLGKARQRGVYFHGGAGGWYTPIAGGSGMPFAPRPLYSGLLLCSSFLGLEMVQTQSDQSTPDIGIYAFRKPRQYVVINKGVHEIKVSLPRGESMAKIQRLTAPSLIVRTGIE
jgi:hypothetical protein